MPVNSVRHNGIFMKRQLDCAVIQPVHKIRESKGMELTILFMVSLKKVILSIPVQAFATRPLCRLRFAIPT